MRSTRHRIRLGLVALTVMLAGATAAIVETGEAAGKRSRLQAFGSCGELLAYVKRHALPLVGPYGFGPGGVVALPAVGPSVAAGAERSAAVPGVDFSTTNVQEAGVDEPDIVKSDGERLYTIAYGKLQAVDVSGQKPRLLGSLALQEGWSHQLLLDGERLLVISQGSLIVEPLPGEGVARSSMIAPPLQTLLTEVDARDPAQLRITETLRVDGSFVSARLVNGSVRVVLTAPMPSRLPFLAPVSGEQAAATGAKAHNQRLVERSGIASWLPRATHRVGRSGKQTTRSLSQCRSVSRPVTYSGLGSLTVLTIDLAQSLKPVDSDTIVTDGQVVYASTTGLYVATQKWMGQVDATGAVVPPDGIVTSLHKFDISQRARTEYRASGDVLGHLLNQWSMSEHNGMLRVASTDTPVWWNGQPPRESSSIVTVLEDRDGKLQQIGLVGGLGRGERIYSVRFMGDVGYVVTFRQVDPLYTLDLSIPAQPRVLGELKILGFSSYLHPVGEDLLLGVGQDASDQGRVLGSQLSLFDISDLRKPSRLHQKVIGPGSSEAEYDHHAFLYWPLKRLVVLPVQTYAIQPDNVTASYFGGVIGFRVSRGGGVQEIGKVTHELTASGGSSGAVGAVPIRRSLVVGSTLFTISEAGVKASSADTLAEQGWVAFSS